MRLLSATVRSYRVHRDLTVEFDPARTVIGGPNESGKSTLVEAIHNGLFLKSRVTGEVRESVVSTVHPGHPVVELRFEAGGKQYHLVKQFSGASGTTRLTEVGGPSWSGDEAEARLADLLGVGYLGTGKTSAERLRRQWAHLWVWQGQSSQDPLAAVSGRDGDDPAAVQQQRLVQRLQEVGGAVAYQSTLDQKIADYFAERRRAIFDRHGKVRKGSELGASEEAAEQARQEWERAKARLEQLREALEGYERAVATVEETSSEIASLSEQLDKVGKRLARAYELAQEVKVKEAGLSDITAKLDELEGLEERIAQLDDSATTLQKELEPAAERLRTLESGLAELREQERKATSACGEAERAARESRLRRDLAAAWVDLLRCEADCEELRSRLDRVVALEAGLNAVREDKLKLPPVDSEVLAGLQRLERRLFEAEAALQAMGATLEVVASDQPVWVGGDQVEPGGSRSLTEVTEVVIGASVRLKISPGGGDSLSQRREEVQSARLELQARLDRLGIGSVREAAEAAAQLGELNAREDRYLEALKQWDPPQALRQAQEQAEERRQALAAEVERRLALITGESATSETVVTRPVDLPAARLWLEREEAALQEAEALQESLRAAREAARSCTEQTEAELERARVEWRESHECLTRIQGQLELLLNLHGDEASRRETLESTRKAKAQAEAELLCLKESLEALQPEVLEADKERLTRAIEEAKRVRQEAQTAQAVNLQLLRLDGSEDPQRALEEAAAAYERAQEDLAAAQLRAEALCLLDDLFQDEQRTLAEVFSRPLAERITGYLQCLFGQAARAEVAFDNNTFRGVRLIRSDTLGALDFERLSEGAKEQVAAAVRLAVADLLAADHDGSLPVVFDDAFAYSDPERVQTLQSMLDRAARRGLQIIVLTCNPADYASLGARRVTVPG